MRILLALIALIAPLTLLQAQEAPPRVLITDSGVKTSVVGPGAPAHTIGLQRHEQIIVMDTGARQYGIRYGVAFDEKRPGLAIPGEGYIGMPVPSSANWYHGGFFDLQINGKSIGSTPVHSMTSRAAGGRGSVDLVFDTPMSVVRIRFVTLGGSDALYCQALLEPKEEVKSLRVVLRCYPSAFVQDADRHVLTPTRDLAQGEKAELDLATENWLLYYDRIFDAGYASGNRRGVGGCSVLWPGSQAEKAGFTVGGYGIDTSLNLKPQLRDFRFVFFDYNGKKNEAAMADLRGRADQLLRDLATFPFTDQSVANWPLTEKQQAIQKVLAAMPAEKEVAANYARWQAQLAEQLKLVQSGAAGAIMAEAEAATTIQEWERGLPELELKALLEAI